MYKSYVELIKDKIRISFVVGKSVALKSKGKDLWGLCPFHQEVTPSFSVNDEKRFYHCFGCGAHGDIFSFLTELHNFSFLEALKTLSDVAGISLPEKDQKEYKNYELTTRILANASEWFVKNLHIQHKNSILPLVLRRISIQCIKTFKVGYAPRCGLIHHLESLNFHANDIENAGLLDNSYNDYFKNRIIFPIHNSNNKVIGFGGREIDLQVKRSANFTVPKYLNSKENVFFKKSEVLYGIELARKFCKASLIIVEGYMDVIALHQHGINNAVGILGTAFSANHFNIASTITQNIIFCYDGDLAGKKATERTIKTLLMVVETDIRIKFLILDKGDPEEYLKSNGVESFKLLMQSSTLLSDVLWEIIIEDNSLDHPEDYFAVENKISEYTAIISNKSLKKYYADFFKNKIYQSRFKNKKNANARSFIANKTVVSTPPSNVQLLLKLILDHPILLKYNEVYDDLAMLDIQDKDLSLVQQHIIDHYNNSREIFQISLSEHLLQHNIKLKQIHAIPHVIYGVYSVEVALLTWRKLIINMQIDSLKVQYIHLLSEVGESIAAANEINSIVLRIKELTNAIEKII